MSWPELNRLDDIAYRAEGFARTEDFAAVGELMADLLEAGKAVTPESVPSNVADPKQVESVLADLSSLVDSLGSDPGEASVKGLVLGLHPVIEKLIKASGMPHIHANEGPNDGFLHPIFDSGGKQVGTAEIKLHDDAGDLEVWLTRGGHGGAPWRLSLDTKLSLVFPDLSPGEVILAVRDRERNEDESGVSTIHGGTTAYFVFPGGTGVDASWLTGREFAAKAELRFDGATTGSFVLRPHIHKDGH